MWCFIQQNGEKLAHSLIHLKKIQKFKKENNNNTKKFQIGG